jgi:hypothetical protein
MIVEPANQALRGRSERRRLQAGSDTGQRARPIDRTRIRWLAPKPVRAVGCESLAFAPDASARVQARGVPGLDEARS